MPHERGSRVATRRSARIIARTAPPFRPFGLISDEVLLCILSALYNQCVAEDGHLAGLVPAALVSRRFGAIAQPLLWRSLSIQHCSTMIKIDDVLMERPALARSVRELVIGDEVVSQEHCRADIDSSCALQFLLHHCAVLEDLQVLANIWPIDTQVPSMALWGILKAPMSPLRTLTLVSERGMASTSAFLLTSLLGHAKGLRDLFLYGISIPEIDHDHPPKEGGCQLDVVELEACSFSIDALRGLAAHCREVSVLAITGCAWATQSMLLSLLPADVPTSSLEMGGINRCDDADSDELGVLGDATHEALDEFEARFSHLHFVRLGRHLEASQRYEPEPESIGYSASESTLSLANTFPAPLPIDMLDHLALPGSAPNVKTLRLFDFGTADDKAALGDVCRERGIELVLIPPPEDEAPLFEGGEGDDALAGAAPPAPAPVAAQAPAMGAGGVAAGP